MLLCVFGGAVALFLPLWFNSSSLNGSFSCRFENFIFSSLSIDFVIILILFLVFELEIYYIILLFFLYLLIILLVMIVELISNVV